MATIAVAMADGRMSVGRVFERAFATIRHNPLVMLAVAFLFGALPSVAVQYFVSQIPSYAFVMTVGSIVLPGALALGVVNWFKSLIFGVVVQGAFVRPVIAEHEGRRVTMADTVAAAARALPSLLILGVILGVSVIIGTTLLIIPGVILYVFWSVAAPALAEERDGVFLALSRSQELIAGARWKVFAIVAILGAATIALALAVSVVLGIFIEEAADVAPLISLRLLIVGLLSTILSLGWGAVQASLYVELREWKEGGSPETLGQVFA